jgi:Domain of Unknown Function (DUF928)
MGRAPKYFAAALALVALFGLGCGGSAHSGGDAPEIRYPAPIILALADWPASRAQDYLSGADRTTRRLGDEVRGEDGCHGPVSLAVLTPPYTGVTLDRQPTLQWFLGHNISAPIEIEVWGEATSEPLLVVSYQDGLPAGIHALALADHGVELEAGVEHEWSVAVLCDRDDRAGDIVSVGTIRRIVPPPDLVRELDGASLESQAELLVEYGVWYDALETLTNLIKRQSDGDQWRSDRARLLEQVGLHEAAAYEP